ncbi:MAG: hypothetical protein Q8L48_32785 [Archangium sp.]|nr:hypothetical protein [Archangium sp.]
MTRAALPDEQLRARLHDRRFVTAGNPHGVSGVDTVFHYLVDGPVITGTYRGGRVREGHLVGRGTGPDAIELLYHCVTTHGELLAGWSRGRVGADACGRTTLAFEWGWLSGAEGGGESRYVELSGAPSREP